MRWPTLRAALVMPLLLVPIGCGKDIQVHPSPKVTQALFDPPTTLPLPTDLAKDPTTGLLSGIPDATDPNDPKQDAQRYFNAYLRGLNGYPTSAVGEVTFDGEIDASSINKDTIPVIELPKAKGGAPVLLDKLVYDFPKNTAGNCAGSPTAPCKVKIWNYAGWKRGTSYVALVRGGANGVQTLIDGVKAPVVRSGVMELVASATPLCAYDISRALDATQGCVLPAPGTSARGCCTFNYAAPITSSVSKAVQAKLAGHPIDEVEAAIKKEVLASATQLEQIRLGYDQLLNLLAAAVPGLSRADVALVWNFTTLSGNEAVFDPTTSQVPTPTDLIRDPTTGLLAVPSAPTASDAEKEFNAYLSTLNGYPTSTSATAMSVIGELDSSSLAGNVLVYEVAATGFTPVTDVTVAYDPTSSRVIVQRKAGFGKRGATYAVFATGLKDKDGKALGRSPLMTLALSPTPLCTLDAKQQCTDVGVPTAFVDDPAGKTDGMTALQKATLFEHVRLGFDSLVKGFEAASGKKRADVVALWSFTIVSMTEVVYDPTAGAIPFPNNLLLDGAKAAQNPPVYQVAIPATPGESDSAKALRLGLNSLDGFTTQGNYFAAVTGPVDPASIGVTNAISFNMQTGQPGPMTFSFVGTAPALVATPALPLDEKTMYGIVLISRVKAGDPKPADAASLKDDKGRRLVAAPFMALLRNRHPLVDSAGKSTVSTLDNATAAQAEQARLAQKPFFDGLEANTTMPIKREDIVAAWTFRTMTITDPLPKLRALPWQVFAAADSQKPAWTGHFDPTLTGFPASAPKDAIGGWVPDGTFTSWNGLDEQGSGAFLPNPAAGKAMQVPFMMTVPKGAAPAEGWPVVVFQHGITRARTDFLAVANSMAKAGFATLSFDIIYHGARSWCTADAQCVAPGTCNKASGQCSTSLVLGTDGVPAASGQRFLNVANPFATRDNIRQHVIDAASLLRALALNSGPGGITTPAPAPALNPAKVYYLSQSMGSILGTLVLSVDSLPTKAVLNVPGAPLPNIIFNGAAWKDIKAAVLASQNVTEGSIDYLKLGTIFNWILDPADPGNFARYLKTKQLPDLVKNPAGTTPVPAKQFIMQLATNDQVIPIQFGQYLASAAGLDPTLLKDKLTYANQGHGFLLKPDPDLPATAAAQTQAAVFLTTGTVCTPNLTAGSCQ